MEKDKPRTKLLIIIGITLIVAAFITSKLYVYSYETYLEQEQKLIAKDVLKQRMSANFLILFGFPVPQSEKQEDQNLKKIWARMFKLHKNVIWYTYKSDIVSFVGKGASGIDTVKQLGYGVASIFFDIEKPSSTTESVKESQSETAKLLGKHKQRLEDAKETLKYFDINLSPFPTEKELLTGIIEEYSQEKFNRQIPNEYARHLAEGILLVKQKIDETKEK